jgi:DHA1 family bicyclomycin/chloramphenicol resistance-like MFS transporter
MKKVHPIPKFLIFLLISLSGLTETIYSAALPKIAEQLNTQGSIAQLSSTAYYFGFALGVFTLGRISDFYGRRPVVLFGISVYLLITIAISQVNNITFFILLRFLQAYGASIGSVIAQTMVRDSYKDWELSYVYAISSLVVSLIPSIGSITGSYIIAYYDSWQYIFYLLVLLSSLMLLIYLKFLPETNLYIGADYNSAFWPLLKTILRDKKLIAYAIIVGSYHGINLGFYLQAPFVFIEKLNMPLEDYGKPFIMVTAATLFGGMMSTIFIKRRFSTVIVKVTGFTLSALGCIALNIGAYFILPYSHDIKNNIFWIFGPVSLHLIGHSMLIPMLLRHALENYQKNSGSAGSIFGGIYYCITSMVTLMIATTHTQEINHYAAILFIIVSFSAVLFYYVRFYNNSRNIANVV